MTEKDYLRAYARELRDLPRRQRRELVAEMRQHLAELPAGTDLLAQLGRPQQHATDMRAAAGVERRHGPMAFFRARWRSLVFIALLLTLIGLSIGAVVWIDDYQPLHNTGGFSSPPDGAHEFGLNGEAVTFREGKPFNFGQQFQNTGRFTVRVLGLAYDRNMPWTARLLMNRTYTGQNMKYPPFHPFDLRPGEFGFLILNGVWACHGEHKAGDTVTLHDFPVRYGFLWRKATATIRLSTDLAIQFKKGCHSR